MVAQYRCSTDRHDGEGESSVQSRPQTCGRPFKQIFFKLFWRRIGLTNLLRAHAVNLKVLRSTKLGSFYLTASAYWSIVEGNKTIVRATAVNAPAYVNYLSRWRGAVGWFIERFPVPSALTMQIPCGSVIYFRILFAVDYTGRRDNHEVCVLSPQQSPHSFVAQKACIHRDVT
jgi:hypothetical protein